MNKYVVYWEDEYSMGFDTLEQVAEYLRELRDDYIADNKRDAEMYPGEFPEGYDHDAAAREWMADVIEVRELVQVQF